MKVRKKPVEVEAFRLPPVDDNDVEPFLDWCAEVGLENYTSERDGGIAIETLEGTMSASPGDWIIRGVAGEFYPCKPDIFAKTYEDAATPGPQQGACCEQAAEKMRSDIHWAVLGEDPKKFLGRIDIHAAKNIVRGFADLVKRVPSPVRALSVTQSEPTATKPEPVVPEECRSCKGYGHFWENGRPTLNKNARKCLDCSGTGEVLR